MMRKINLWLRKHAVPGMWGAGGCIVTALFCAHLLEQSTAANAFFIVGFVLAGVPILFRAIQGLHFKTVSIELLVSIAAIGACCIGEFSKAAIVTFLFQFGSFLEQKTMKKTRSAIKSLTEMAPSTAWRIAGDTIEEIDADEVEEEDILLGKTGNQIARVHGEHHPELAQVVELYEKAKACPYAEVIAELRKVTSDYTIPEDACPTYGKTYEDLTALDREYTEAH